MYSIYKLPELLRGEILNNIDKVSNNNHFGYTFFVNQLGAVGDGKADDTKPLEQAIQQALRVNGTVILTPGKTYRITKPLSFKGGNKSVKINSNCNGPGKPKILFDIKNGLAMNFSGEVSGSSKNLIYNEKAGSKFISLNDMDDIKPRQLCEMSSTKSWYHDPRPPANPPYTWVGYNIGKLIDGSKDTITLPDKFDPKPEDVPGRHFTILDGKNKGFSATVTEYDGITKKAKFTPEMPNEIVPETSYIFPQAFKGELNVVERTLESKVELRNILFDGYHITNDSNGPPKEVVTVNFFNPISVLIENVDFDWVPSDKFSQFEMIRVLYGIDCIFRNVTINNARRIGFQIERSYNTLIESCSVSHSNNNFLGYGVNIQNSTHSMIQNSWFWGCRRGVDFDSVRDFDNAYPSRLGTVDSCINYGGGVREPNRPKEAPWYPEGDYEETKARNFGFGSHGPADHMTYSNNTIINTYRGIFLRGTNERVINNKFIGKMEECIGIWFGGNHTIEGNEYIHPSMSGELDFNENYREVLNFDGNNFNVDLPKRFIGIAILNHAPVNYQRGFITVKNNIARGVRKEFFYHQWSAGKYMEDISLEDNHVVIWPEHEDDIVHFVNSNHSGEIRNFLDKNNYINVKTGNFYPYRERNRLTESCTLIPADSNKRVWYQKNNKEIRTTSGFKLAEVPQFNQGVQLGHISVRPYSKMSKFNCNFESSASLSDNEGRIVVALFRGATCITSKIFYSPAKNMPIDISFNFIDKPVMHKKVTYSVRIGIISDNESEVVVNDKSFNLGGTTGTLLTVRELA